MVENVNIYKFRFFKGIMVKYFVKNNGKVEEVKIFIVKNILILIFNYVKVIFIFKFK